MKPEQNLDRNDYKMSLIFNRKSQRFQAYLSHNRSCSSNHLFLNHFKVEGNRINAESITEYQLEIVCRFKIRAKILKNKILKVDLTMY